MITGFLGRTGRLISCKLGHSVGRVATVEVTIAVNTEKVRKMEVILGERNKEMNGINGSSILNKEREFRLGRRGSLMGRDCRTEKTSKDRTLGVPHSLSVRIL